MAEGSFFQRLKQGLSKNRETWVEKISAIFQNREWDEQSLDAMEESLLTADVGVKATQKLLDALRRQAPDGSEDIARQMAARLQAAMVEMLAAEPRAVNGAPPSVKPCAAPQRSRAKPRACTARRSTAGKTAKSSPRNRRVSRLLARYAVTTPQVKF